MFSDAIPVGWPKTKKSLLELMGKLQIERIEGKKQGEVESTAGKHY